MPDSIRETYQQCRRWLRNHPVLGLALVFAFVDSAMLVGFGSTFGRNSWQFDIAAWSAWGTLALGTFEVAKRFRHTVFKWLAVIFVEAVTSAGLLLLIEQYSPFEMLVHSAVIGVAAGTIFMFFHEYLDYPVAADS